MTYPTFEQYNNAFQAHQRLLDDPELQRGTVAKTGMGTPLAISGGFALTYTIKTGTKKYAVHASTSSRRLRGGTGDSAPPRAIALPIFPRLRFQPKGIRVEGNAYPVVRMAWAQGMTLGEFLEDNHGERGS